MKLNMKKMFYVTAVIVVACVIASSAIAAVTTEPAKSNEETAPVSQDFTYILTVKQGRIVAYIKGVEVPYIETATAVNSLPYDVQERLRAGIEFSTQEELQEAINEYCS